VREAFGSHGPLEKVKRMKDYAFVHFEEREHALKAMEALNGHEGLGKGLLEVSLARPVSDKVKQKREQRKMEHHTHRWGGGAPAVGAAAFDGGAAGGFYNSRGVGAAPFRSGGRGGRWGGGGGWSGGWGAANSAWGGGFSGGYWGGARAPAVGSFRGGGAPRYGAAAVGGAVYGASGFGGGGGFRGGRGGGGGGGFYNRPFSNNGGAQGGWRGRGGAVGGFGGGGGGGFRGGGGGGFGRGMKRKAQDGGPGGGDFKRERREQQQQSRAADQDWTSDVTGNCSETAMSDSGFTVKTPVTQLNELRQGQVAYVLISQSGPPHCPVFEMACRVDGREFRANGHSKQEAKQEAARLAVAALLNSASAPAAPLPHGLPPAPRGQLQMRSRLAHLQPRSRLSFLAALPTPPASQQQQKGLPSASELATKNPVSIINELRPNGVTFHLVDTKEAPGRTPRFVMQCVVDGYAYTAEANNKKVAKMRSAQVALREAFHLMSTYSGSGDSASPCQAPAATPTEQSFADSVQRLVRDQFEQLASGLSERLARRKVLAGIVMSRGPDLDPSADLTVVCVTTGPSASPASTWTPAVPASSTVTPRFSAGDACCNFFITSWPPPSRATPNQFFNWRPTVPSFGVPAPVHQHFALRRRPSLRAHGPRRRGGDASGDATEAANEDEHPTRASRGLLRTKIECGEGTIPVPATLVAQTWDGILGRANGCSQCPARTRWPPAGVPSLDCDWLVVQPVALPARALIGRLQRPAPGLPVAEPALLGVTERDPRQARAAPDCSLNWYCLDGVQPELVNSSTGRLVPETVTDASDNASRLSKRALFANYARLVHLLRRQHQAQSRRPQQQLRLPPVPKTGSSGITYREAKEACTEYRSAKSAMIGFLRQNGKGLWAAKPWELQEFTFSRCRGLTAPGLSRAHRAAVHSLESHKIVIALRAAAAAAAILAAPLHAVVAGWWLVRAQRVGQPLVPRLAQVDHRQGDLLTVSDAPAAETRQDLTESATEILGQEVVDDRIDARAHVAEDQAALRYGQGNRTLARSTKWNGSQQARKEATRVTTRIVTFRLRLRAGFRPAKDPQPVQHAAGEVADEQQGNDVAQQGPANEQRQLQPFVDDFVAADLLTAGSLLLVPIERHGNEKGGGRLHVEVLHEVHQAAAEVAKRPVGVEDVDDGVHGHAEQEEQHVGHGQVQDVRVHGRPAIVLSANADQQHQAVPDEADQKDKQVADDRENPLAESRILHSLNFCFFTVATEGASAFMRSPARKKAISRKQAMRIYQVRCQCLALIHLGAQQGRSGVSGYPGREAAKKRQRSDREEAEKRQRSGREEAEKSQKRGKEEAENRQRRGRKKAEKRQRKGREAAEKRQRSGRKAAEKRQKIGREVAEKRQRRGREEAEKRQRKGREEAEKRQRCDREKAEKRQRSGRERRGREEAKKRQRSGREEAEERQRRGREEAEKSREETETQAVAKPAETQAVAKPAETQAVAKPAESRQRHKQSLSRQRHKQSLSRQRHKQSLSRQRHKQSLSRQRHKQSLSRQRHKQSLSRQRHKQSLSAETQAVAKPAES
uniref:DRBM domain-containing protein n=1 Tax=Macrostomum lignano TaxID=282301 RepID=A0A1I8IU31_9PLAT